MESLNLQKEKITKDISNLFRSKKELNGTAIKNVRNLFRQEKETKVIKGRILRDISNLFEHEEEENYYKPVRVTIWSNNYIEYESNGDRNKTLSVEDYLNRIRPYLKNIMNNLKKSDPLKIHLAIANNFISSNGNYEEHIIHSKSDNIELRISDEADEVIKEFSDSLKNIYQNNLKTMKVIEVVFDYVHLAYYKYHEINPNCGG